MDRRSNSDGLGASSSYSANVTSSPNIADMFKAVAETKKKSNESMQKENAVPPSSSRPRPTVKFTYGKRKRESEIDDTTTTTSPTTAAPRILSFVEPVSSLIFEEESKIDKDDQEVASPLAKRNHPDIKEKANVENPTQLPLSSIPQTPSTNPTSRSSKPTPGQSTLMNFFSKVPKSTSKDPTLTTSFSSPALPKFSSFTQHRQSVSGFLSSPPLPSFKAPYQHTASSTPSSAPKYQQLYLELGQKNLGPITCKECGMSYHRGQQEDEALHDQYHKKAIGGIDWPGYKKEEPIWENAVIGDKIIVIDWTKSSAHEKKKALEILEMVTKELGAVPISSESLAEQNMKFYLYIVKKKVVGCALVEPLEKAFRRIPPSSSSSSSNDSQSTTTTNKSNDGIVQCEETPSRVVLGISRIWVLASYRRRQIASTLISTLLKKFCFGMSLRPDQDLAFSQPTADGIRLAVKVSGRQDFLVYFD